MGCGRHAFKKSVFSGWYPGKEKVLVGEITRNELIAPPHDRWFNKRYDRYSPDEGALGRISESLQDIDSIRIILGSWCLDSRVEVPKLYKILDESHFSKERVRITAIEFSKKALENLKHTSGVDAVPTIIFYKEGKELNRFVEYSQSSFEKDIDKIISSAGYKHSNAK